MWFSEIRFRNGNSQNNLPQCDISVMVMVMISKGNYLVSDGSIYDMGEFLLN
jgi:hypothetical protein